MRRIACFVGALLAALPAGAMASCMLADDCAALLDCGKAAPPPSTCEGTCVPHDVSVWLSPDPWMVWKGESNPAADLCAVVATTGAAYATWTPTEAFDGEAAVPLDCVSSCTCDPSVGSCALPTTVTTSPAPCGELDGGSPYNPPDPWDGGCTAPATIANGLGSVTVGPVAIVTESCAAQRQSPPVPTVVHAHACGGMVSGSCANPSDVCEPALPSAEAHGLPRGKWMYCMSAAQGQEDGGLTLCKVKPYTHTYVFGSDCTDTRACTDCICGAPTGSGCTDPLVTLYEDSQCNQVAGAVHASASGPECVDLPPDTPLGSMNAAPSVYVPGSCSPGASMPTGSLTCAMQMTFCCTE